MEDGQVNKRLITLIGTIVTLIPLSCFAWTLSWDALPSAESYNVEYSVSPLTNPTVDNVTVTSYDIDALGLTPGTRYEFVVKACQGSPPQCFGESDHLRWTMPDDPVIVEMPPEQKVINVIIQR